MKNILIFLFVGATFLASSQDQYEASKFLIAGKFKKNKINKGAFYQRNRPHQGSYEAAYKPTEVSDVLIKDGELRSFKVTDCSKLTDGLVFNVAEKENKMGQTYAYGYTANNPYVADKIFAFFKDNSLYIVYGAPPFAIGEETYIYAILGDGDLSRKKLQVEIIQTYEGDFSVVTKQPQVEYVSSNNAVNANNQINQIKALSSTEFNVLYNSNGYNETRFTKKLIVNEEEGFFKSISFEDKTYYADNIAFPRFFGSSTGRYSVIEGELFIWNQSDHNITLKGVGVQSGKVKSITEKHKKILNDYLVNTEDAALQAKNEFDASSERNIRTVLFEKVKQQMEATNYDNAFDAILEYEKVMGLSEDNPVVKGLLNECREKINEQKELSRTAQKEASLDALKSNLKSIYGKEIEKIEILVDKQNHPSYTSGYFSYFCPFSVSVLTTLKDGTTITSKNIAEWDEKNQALINYQELDFEINAYGCRRNEALYHPYPIADDGYNPAITIEVTSRYDESLSKKIEIPIGYSEAVEMDYRNHQAIQTEDGRNFTVEVWMAKNDHNEKTIVLYDIYEAGVLVNTVFLAPNVDLWIYNSGVGSPKGADGAIAVVVKDSRVQGVYSVKTNTKISQSPLITSAVSQQTEEDPTEITIKNNTGKSVCIAHYGGSTSIGNGSSESFSCRDLFYGVMQGANCTGTKGAKIADKETDCGRTITLD